MKKIIAVLLILVIGLFALEGCSSNNASTNENQQTQNPAQQENKQPAGNDNIPQPPPLPEE